MQFKKSTRLVIQIGLAFFFLIGCSTSAPAPTNTPLPPSATSVPDTPSPTVEPTSTPVSYDDIQKLFAYDAAVPLNVEERSVEDRTGIKVQDIAFSDVNGSPVSAYLVLPPGDGPFAGVLFLHWLEIPEGSRTEFLDEAVTLAAQGVVSILPQGKFPWTTRPRSAEADTAAVAEQVIVFRRAMDALLAQPGVDPERIGVVGHDFGAMYGAILAGVDSRAKTYVLMAGTPQFADWFLVYWQIASNDEQRKAYRIAMKPYNPTEHIQYAAPATVFFQFAVNDVYISRGSANNFYEAASEPKRVEWYEADHALNDVARDDRLAWLVEQLELTP